PARDRHAEARHPIDHGAAHPGLGLGAVDLLQNAEFLLGGECPALRPLGPFRIGGGGRAYSFIPPNSRGSESMG
ncbi:MAG TPA: hypothetical protein VKA17_08725, partial [Gammaproteobacteria bacterium]|nr:hypothetical protein [Gammaproteobacteria bacterium]